jgi:hypothetical protein
MKLTERDLDRVELFLDDTNFDGHALNWDELVMNFGFDISGQTLQRRMNQRNFFLFIACNKPWIPEIAAARRVAWCQLMLSKYPKSEDWHHVRFSDEVHFGWGPKGKTRIIRRRGFGQRGAPSNIQRMEVKDDDYGPQNRVHFWGACGHGFKVEKLIQYTVPTNTNGKMTKRV